MIPVRVFRYQYVCADTSFRPRLRFRLSRQGQRWLSDSFWRYTMWQHPEHGDCVEPCWQANQNVLLPFLALSCNKKKS